MPRLDGHPGDARDPPTHERSSTWPRRGEAKAQAGPVDPALSRQPAGEGGGVVRAGTGLRARRDHRPEKRETPPQRRRHATEGDVGWVVSEHGRHAGYVNNLEAHPDVRVRMHRQWRPARARIVDDDDPKARLVCSAGCPRGRGAAVRHRPPHHPVRVGRLDGVLHLADDLLHRPRRVVRHVGHGLLALGAVERLVAIECSRVSGDPACRTSHDGRAPRPCAPLPIPSARASHAGGTCRDRSRRTSPSPARSV